MDQCYEGLAVPLVRAGRRRGAVQLLHQQGEDEEGGQERVRRDTISYTVYSRV